MYNSFLKAVQSAPLSKRKFQIFYAINQTACMSSFVLLPEAAPYDNDTS